MAEEDFAQTQRRNNEKYISQIRREERLSLIVRQAQPVDSFCLATDPALAELVKSMEAYTPEPADLQPALGLILQADKVTLQELTKGLIAVRKLLHASQAVMQPIIDSGAIWPLINLVINSKEAQVQLEALWILTNICSGNEQQTNAVIDKGFLPTLSKLIKHPLHPIRQQAYWCVGNVVVGSQKNRDDVIAKIGVERLVRHAEPFNTSQLLIAVWAVSNICRVKPNPHYKQIMPAVPLLCQCILKQRNNAKNALWGLSSMAASKSIRNCPVGAKVFCPELLAAYYDILARQVDQQVEPTIRILKNLLQNKIRLVPVPEVDILLPALSQSKKAIRKETIELLGFIAALDGKEADLLASSRPLVLRTREMLLQQTTQVKRQILIFLLQLAKRCDTGLTLSLFGNSELNLFELLTKQLKSGDGKYLILLMATLETVLLREQRHRQRQLLERFVALGGPSELQAFQLHKSEKVYEASCRFIEKFFVEAQ